MTMNYQMESSHIAEYDLYTVPGVNFTLRGPQWPLSGSTPSISFLGAAQTFGVFCKYPFPNLIGEMCSARVLNFGRGGAGPGFFSEHQPVLDYVNRTDCCVVQLMSARSSVKNAYMESVEGLTTVRMLRGRKKGQTVFGHIAYRELSEELGRAEFHSLVEETRDGYIEQFRALAQQISVPKILVYVGRNAPLVDRKVDEDWTVNDLIGVHPHMISNRVVESVSDFFDGAVICHGGIGFNKKIINRFTGEYSAVKRSDAYTISKHDAYISPYLHTKAALSLFKPISDILG